MSYLMDMKTEQGRGLGFDDSVDGSDPIASYVAASLELNGTPGAWQGDPMTNKAWGGEKVNEDILIQDTTMIFNREFYVDTVNEGENRGFDRVLELDTRNEEYQLQKDIQPAPVGSILEEEREGVHVRKLLSPGRGVLGSLNLSKMAQENANVNVVLGSLNVSKLSQENANENGPLTNPLELDSGSTTQYLPRDLIGGYAYNGSVFITHNRQALISVVDD
ncbi:hypothetical protein RIF29_09127 [Crotalaria pallida]|uniref:Uncharacterized protein n=1 Tax=Crotalaria pallida TaxID=3830 RepID=A0AAN9IKI0_CROPI